MMHTIYIHIDENLTIDQLNELSNEIRQLSHVTDVEISHRTPHDLLVEYEPHTGMPMPILQQLSQRGLHTDVTSC